MNYWEIIEYCLVVQTICQSLIAYVMFRRFWQDEMKEQIRRVRVR